ncbi:MAG: hypothetical protein ACXVPM_09400, partial [Bacteroidia bacterium]
MKNTFKYFISSMLFLFVTTAKSQVVGGRGNSQSSPKEVKAGELSKGAYTADVNLFNGALSTSYTLGTVSTPSGLSYTLSMGYSSTFTGGDNAPVSKGISYGEGWSLNLPTISITTEAYNKYTKEQIAHQNSSSTDTGEGDFPEFSSSEASLEGKTFWFSPEINIPGVISERFVYKYTEREGGEKGELVFVPSKFDSYTEARLKDNVWRVITEDGTVYEFGVGSVNVRNASNQRYIVGDVSSVPSYPSQNVFTPSYEYLNWTISKIYHPNYPNGQQIQFLYEYYGAFNYYQELMQPELADALAGGSIGDFHNFSVYKDVQLKTVRSVENFGTEYIEKIELNYKTRYPLSGETYNDILLPGQTGVSRLDSLYNYKTVYSTGINNTTEQGIIDPDAAVTTSGNFADWIRYYHFRADDVQSSSYSGYNMNSQNPYVYSDGSYAVVDGGVADDPAGVSQHYLRKKVTTTNADDIPFDDCFLESPKIGYSGTYFPTGDIYQIRTLLTNGASEKYCNFDINIVAGKSSSTSYVESDPGTSSISQIEQNTFNRNLNTTVF